MSHTLQPSPDTKPLLLLKCGLLPSDNNSDIPDKSAPSIS